MKKKLFILTLLLSVFTLLPLAAQNNNDTIPTDEIEAYSDTTSVPDTSVVAIPPIPMDDYPDFDDDDDFSGNIFQLLIERNREGLAGMFFVLALMLILFVLAPVLIIGLILWFIYKNRKNRMHLAEMAMKTGQPIPGELVSPSPEVDTDVRSKGIRQVCLGIGLIFLLGWAAGKIGAGIGILVLCIGLGNLYIARSSNKVDS